MSVQEISGTVPTANAGRYLQQLCRHWQHKLEVSHSEERAEIRMPSGDLVNLEADDAALNISIRSSTTDSLAITRGVVEEHLNRFAFREAPLAFSWA
ncbi:DUF2218 domain-containing protein [Terrihabitans sp. B22-R8]|uniref:DUF2218 domain-containing protein n=1 Tax=Terrihabitans sp. B22-R8 TaxID=3425128 RepID=UPI00403C1F95